MAICKSRGLNPFKKDAYLIKYGDDPAAIVTSIDYFRARARAQKDCVGWKKGIILKDAEGKIKDSAGLIQDGETLLGGFFEAAPAGWTQPFRLEVNIKGYIKKTREGKVTKFWSDDNQPSQIAKVAESQGLRTLWPDEFQGLYEETEIKAHDNIDMTATNGTTYEAVKPEPDTTRFDSLAKDKVYKPEKLAEFIKLSAGIQSKSDAEIKALAQDHFEDFWQQFMKWVLKDKPVEAPKTENGKTEGKDKLELKGDGKSEAEPILKTVKITDIKLNCPNSDSYVEVGNCEKCKSRSGCPAWEKEDQAA